MLKKKPGVLIGILREKYRCEEMERSCCPDDGDDKETFEKLPLAKLADGNCDLLFGQVLAHILYIFRILFHTNWYAHQ